MRKLLILATLILTACAQEGVPAVSTTQAQERACTTIIDLPHAQVWVNQHESLLWPVNVSAVKIGWQAADGTKGTDWVTGSNKPDKVLLGCMEGVTFTELDWKPPLR